MDFEKCKEGLLALLLQAVDDPNEKGYLPTGILTRLLVKVSSEKMFDSAETQSDLLECLLRDGMNSLGYINDVVGFSQGLQQLFSKEALNHAGIYVDALPEGIVKPGGEYLFINTSDERRAYAVDVEAKVGFMGRWLVEARQAKVVALANTHVSLRDDKARALKFGKNSAALRLPPYYYQPVDCTSFSEGAAQRLASEGSEAALRYLAEQVGEPKAMDLQELRSSVAQEAGDKVLAQDERYTLAVGADQEMTLFRRFAEQEVAQALSARASSDKLNPQLWDLNSSLKREVFWRQTNERLVIGQNHLGKDVSLKLELGLGSYFCSNLYCREDGEWKHISGWVKMDKSASLKEEIEAIKSQASESLNLGQAQAQAQKNGLKR